MVNNTTTNTASATGTGANTNTQNTTGAAQQPTGSGTTALEQFGEELDVQNLQYESMDSTEPVDITNEDRFYGARQPILRGTSVGGVPIFVANQALTPIGILDKKQKAIDEARKKRAEQASKFKLEKAQRLKNANYQKSFDEAFNANTARFVNEAKTIYGDNWTLALGSDKTDVGRKYRQSLSNFQTLKDRADQFTDRAAEIKKRIEAGDASVSEKTARMVREVEGAIGSFSEGKTVDLLGKMDQLNASVNIDNWLNDNIFPNLKQIETKYLSSLMTDKDYEEYKTQISSHTKRILSQAKATAARLKKPNGVFGWDDNITEEDIIDAITTRIGDYTVTGPKVVDKPAKPKGKDYTDEDLSNRLAKLNTISNPFAGGKSKYKDPVTGQWVNSNITTEATAIANELVNSKYEGRIISGAEIKPAGENEDLVNTVKSLFTYYQDKGGYYASKDHKALVEKTIKESKAKLIGSEYDDGTVSGNVKSINFDEKEDNGRKYGVATVSVQTPEGLKTVDYPMDQANAEAGFSKMRDAFKVQYPDANDRIELTLIPSSGSDRFARKPVVIDLSEPGAKWTINGILNESSSEKVDIPTPDMQMREAGIAAGAEQVNTTTTKNNNQNPQKKEEKPVSSTQEYTRAEIEKLAKDKNTTVDKLVKWAKDNKGVTIVIK